MAGLPDLSVGLAAGATLTVSGTVDITLPTAMCNAYVFLCVEFSPGADAGYTDSDTTSGSNIMCVDVSDNMYCVPGKIGNNQAASKPVKRYSFLCISNSVS